MTHKFDEIIMTRESMFNHATIFLYELGHLGEVSIRLRRDEIDKYGRHREWIVYHHGDCWDGETRKFTMDLRPVNRTEEYMKRTEFSLDLAVSILMYIKRIVVDATEEGHDDPFEVARILQNKLY